MRVLLRPFGASGAAEFTQIRLPTVCQLEYSHYD
jgi:hypothetical protein